MKPNTSLAAPQAADKARTAPHTGAIVRPARLARA
jgi:hypothetical protein